MKDRNYRLSIKDLHTDPPKVITFLHICSFNSLFNVTNKPKYIIPTHWDNCRLPYRFSQAEIAEEKLFSLRSCKKISPDTEVIIP